MATWRYIAQNVLTGAFLDWDLPLQRDELTWELSGPGALRGTIDPERFYLSNLEEWQTAIYAEADEQIRWGGLLQKSNMLGSTYQLECAGFSSYPNRIPYVGPLYSKKSWDPIVAFWDIWHHVQTQPDGDLHVSVGKPTNCPVRLGTTEEPYILDPSEAPDCGAELTNLATETPFDWAEGHRWSGDMIAHSVSVGYPRLGRKRSDLAFVQGDNIISWVPLARDGDAFANTIYGLGQGEGSAMVRAEVAQRDGHLRRPYVYTDKTASTKGRLTANARKQFALRRLLPDIASITVTTHAHAPIGSWMVGDDILVQATVPWEGDIAIWCRVMSWSLVSDTTATINLQRSDSFAYSATDVALGPVNGLPPEQNYNAVYDTALYDTGVFQ